MKANIQYQKRFIDVPLGYQCPLCQDSCLDREDDKFKWNILFDGPVCLSCDYYIFALIADDRRIDDPIMDDLEEITGLSFHECQVLMLPLEIRLIEESLIKKREEALISPETSKCQEEIVEYERRIWLFRGYLRKAKIHLRR